MDQQNHQKPIPAFYCCYLLRSTVRHASLYIGSTPDPSRRLAQHNGAVKGGARKTAREKLRPWEMTVIVEGFMSRIAALQFEWAWQHPTDSRHVKPDEGENSNVVINPKTGKAKTRPRPSQRSLTAHLSNLHILLRSPYFSSWSLKVRFFSADVHRVWNLWCQRVDERLPRNVSVISDGSSRPGNDTIGDDDYVGSVQHIRADYSDIQDYLEKATFLLDDPRDLRCQVCEAQVLPAVEMIVVCPQRNCHCIAHLLCLSHRFLNAAEEPEQLVPTHGTCPACKNIVQWPLMMQELTLRRRGEGELQNILKKKGRREKQRSDDNCADRPASTDSAIDETNSLARDLPIAGPVIGSGSAERQRSPGQTARCDSPLDENWLDALELADFDIDDDPQPKQPPSKIEIIIDDSDGLE